MQKKLIIKPCSNIDEVLLIARNHFNGANPLFSQSKEIVLCDKEDNYRFVCIAKETKSSIILQGAE